MLYRICVGIIFPYGAVPRIKTAVVGQLHSQLTAQRMRWASLLLIGVDGLHDNR